MNNQTIAAISTPLGPGGIGIIRVSGPAACEILSCLFLPTKYDKTDKNLKYDKRFTSHRIYYGHIREPNNGRILDEVLAVYMRAPKSFTREDVVEIHSHSGYVVLDRLLSAVIEAGAVLAEAGEFTKRAFLNGRIDLSQAEAVIDLINAPCETAVQLANRQMEGGVRDAVEKIVGDIGFLRANCEASIEFDDTTDSVTVLNLISNHLLEAVLPELVDLIHRQKEVAIYREGVQLSIAGAPNVGKSSLLNKLVDKETAIVSDVPGTTRDVVREYFSIQGIPVVVCDTAGIHDTKDPVECMGIEKARDQFERSDIILLVLEATRPPNNFEKQLVDDFRDMPIIVVVNKDDLADEKTVVKLQSKMKDKRLIRVSAKTGAGIVDLKKLIFNDLVSGDSGPLAEGVSPNLRQRKIFEQAAKKINHCVMAVENGQTCDLVSEKLKDILNVLEDVSGKRSREDLYDHIFSQFCIGK